MIAGAGMGIGAMTVTMLGLPLTSVLIVNVLLQADALTLMPIVIVAVVIAYVSSARLALKKGASPAAVACRSDRLDPRQTARPPHGLFGLRRPNLLPERR